MGYLTEKKDKIINLYQEHNLSIRAIAKVLGCSGSGVKGVLHSNNIYMRNKCESLNLCPTEFTTEEFDIFLGSMLGDGGISRPKGPQGECQFYEGHSTKQKLYVEYKYEKLKRWIGCNIYHLQHNVGGKIHTTLNFLTRRNKKFTELRKLFYVSNEPYSDKILPFDIVSENLNPVSLAIWYMDDGYNRFDKGCEFCSESFNEDDQTKLVGILLNKFNIQSHLRKIRKSEHRISINKSDKSTLFDIVRSHVIPLMEYKLKSSEAIRQTLNAPAFNEDMVRTTRKLVEVF